MSSTWFESLQEATQARETALGIYAEYQAMDDLNKGRSEVRYIKHGPWIMDVDVNGSSFSVNAYSPVECVSRADEIYPEGWTETRLYTQEQFRKENQ